MMVLFYAAVVKNAGVKSPGKAVLQWQEFAWFCNGKIECFLQDT
jgi:hypothetical protein